MTLGQLRVFALVARLGSMRAAAHELGVSEPAVSAAIAALRADLGDALLVRSGAGLALTAGGRRLATHAAEIVRLAERARQEVTSAGDFHNLLRVVASPACGEHAAAALLDAFARRSPGIRVDLQSAEPELLGPLLLDRSADLSLGVRPQGAGLDVAPVLRYQRIVVAAPGHPLAAAASVPASALLDEPWFTGPGGVEERSEEGTWLATGPLPALAWQASEAKALEQVRSGVGVMLALAHVVRRELEAGDLVRLAVPGTPVRGLWSAAVPAGDQALPAARALQRFATTPDATAAMLAGLRAPRPRPPSAVRVGLWS